jgi:CHASE1-domain containing sensor protein
MEVVAILMSLTGLGVAVTLALKEERRAQTQLAECLTDAAKARLRHGPDT